MKYIKPLIILLIFHFVGRGYLEKFKLDVRGGETFLMSAEHVKASQEQEMLIPEWIGAVKKYVMQVQPDLIEDREMVIMIESQIFFTYTEPSRQICVVVSVY